jgi:hypothetical protein
MGYSGKLKGKEARLDHHQLLPNPFQLSLTPYRLGCSQSREILLEIKVISLLAVTLVKLLKFVLS